MLIEAHSKGEGVQDAIHEALARGEHEIVFGTGLHRVTKQISLVDVKHLSIRGMPGAVLQLAPLAFALTETPAKAGETRILVQKIRGLESVTHLRIFAPGKMHPYTGAPAHLFSAALDRADGKVLVLKEPLPFPVPAGTLIVDEHGPNMFDLRGVCEDISIEGLVLDGGRLPDEPVYSAHEQRSILFAHGHYGYEEGPIGAPMRRIRISNCEIKNAFGRGAAFYAVQGAWVRDCHIHDLCDEAIDFDHFVVGAWVSGNSVERCRIGVEINDANECWVSRNRFEDCEIGVNIWRWCKQPNLNERNMILHNLIFNSKKTAVYLSDGTAHNTVEGNWIRGFGERGILDEGANQRMVGNTVIEGGEEGKPR